LHLKRFQDAVRAYWQAVVWLDPDLPSPEFKRLQQHVDEARSLFDLTRHALEVHVNVHGC
jgi:hypothetical protein